MAYSKVSIENIFQLRKGRKALQTDDTQIKESKRYIQINDLRSDDDIKFAVDPKGVEVSPADICIAWDGANAGTIGYGLSGFIGSTIARLRLAEKNKYFTDYIGKYLQSKFYVLNSNTIGATIPHISRERLLSLKIPIPPLREQKRIAAILDKADAIRRKREKAIQLADEFLRSVFLDMFGDPVVNTKGWHLSKFSKVGTLDRGKSKHRPRNAPELLGGEYPLIQTGDVANSDGYIRNYTQTYSELGLKQSRMWPAGTLCITIAANIAKTGILTFDACFPDSIVGFTPNNNVQIEYVQFWMSFLQKILEETAPESAQKNINLRILRDLDIPLPNIKLQNQFANIVGKVETMKSKVKYKLNNSHKLFNSIAQRAFHGEL